MKSVRSWLLSIGTVCAMLASPPAFAQVCTASSSGIAFGSFSPIVGATPASGQIAISCTGLLAFVKICVSVGPGTGQTSYAPRIATNGAVPMNYNLYTDSAGSTILGSRAAAASYAPGSVNVSVLLGTYSQNFTVYGKIQGTQTGLTAGAYTANFADAVITYKTYALLDPVPDCATLAAPFASFQFPVTATVINDCTIASTNIDFGTTGLLTSTLAASGTLSVTCTNAAPYSIALSAGTGAGATPADRRMTRSGGTDQVKYGLYATAAYGTPWGDGTAGSIVASNTGTGTPQQLTVYARVLPQTTPSTGSYLDSVIATITY
jgi:spore coat protein U-like protein